MKVEHIKIEKELSILISVKDLINENKDKEVAIVTFVVNESVSASMVLKEPQFVEYPENFDIMDGNDQAVSLNKNLEFDIVDDMYMRKEVAISFH